MRIKMCYRKAFTLIELMVVLCLCTFLASLVFINISFLDATLARTEIDKLAMVCIYLQQLAMATNQEKHLVFDIKNNAYSFDKQHEKLSQRVCFGVLPGVKGPPGSPQQAVEKVVTFPHQEICFYPTGIISSGTIYIIDKKRQSQYALSNAVSQVSYLRMYRYDGTWKLYHDKLDKK